MGLKYPFPNQRSVYTLLQGVDNTEKFYPFYQNFARQIANEVLTVEAAIQLWFDVLNQSDLPLSTKRAIADNGIQFFKKLTVAKDANYFVRIQQHYNPNDFQPTLVTQVDDVEELVEAEVVVADSGFDVDTENIDEIEDVTPEDLELLSFMEDDVDLQSDDSHPSRWNKTRLTEYANENGIDISGVELKRDIYQLVLNHYRENN